MLRRNLVPTLGQAARAFTARQQGATVGLSSASVPAGGDISLLEESSVTVDAGDGQPSEETHVTAEQAGSLRDAVTRVEQVESAVKNLSAGVSTQGRWNTVSTSDAPSTAEGFPEGAWWTKITSADDFTPAALWTVEDGQWVTKPLPAGQTVAPVMNTGLISAGAVAAAIIQSDEFWTALSGRRVGFNSDGFQAYDENGARTVNLNGKENQLSGVFKAGEWVFQEFGDVSGLLTSGIGSGVTEASPGLVRVKESGAGWSRYLSLRSQLYLAGDNGTLEAPRNGADSDEHSNAYLMLWSADLTSSAADWQKRQQLVAKNVMQDSTQEMWLHGDLAHLKWRHKDGRDIGVSATGSTASIHHRSAAGVTNQIRLTDAGFYFDSVLRQGDGLRLIIWTVNRDITAGGNQGYIVNDLPEREGCKWIGFPIIGDWPNGADVIAKLDDANTSRVGIRLHVQNGTLRAGANLFALLVRVPAW